MPNTNIKQKKERLGKYIFENGISYNKDGFHCGINTKKGELVCVNELLEIMSLRSSMEGIVIKEEEVKEIKGLHQAGDYIVGEKAEFKRGKNQARQEVKRRIKEFFKE